VKIENRLNSDRAYEDLLKSGEDWADKEAAASLLEEMKKSVLAKLKNTVKDAKSDAGAETKALCHEDYEAHIKLMVEARKAATKAKVRYDSAKVLAEMRRSEESTRRAEMTLR
jgi:hypothetical protein